MDLSHHCNATSLIESKHQLTQPQCGQGSLTLKGKSMNQLYSIANALRPVKIIVVIALLAVGARAQTGGSTPLGLSPGSPAGSYPLSDFETVNLYNGGLNFHLPLMSIGSRGATGYSLPLHIEQKWSVSKEINPGHYQGY